MEKKRPQKDSTTSPKQLLRDPDIEPTTDVLAQALGASKDAYLRFVNELANRDIQLVWRYYTDGKAWLAKGLCQWTGARGGKKEMTVFWLSIMEGFFKVNVFVPEKYRADLLQLPLSEDVKMMIQDANQLGERLKFFPVVFDMSSDELFGDLFEMVNFKKTMK